MTATTTHLTHLATVMIPVTDQDAAIDFYVDKLGFEKTRDIRFGPDEADRWVELGLPGNETTIAPMPERGDNWVSGQMTGVSVVTNDIDATHAALRDAGVDVDAEIMRVDGPPPNMFWLRDVDGNTLLVVEG